MLSTMVPVEYIKSYSNPLYPHRHTCKYYVYTYALNVHRHMYICEYKDIIIYRACPRTSCPILLGLRNERAVLGPDCSAPGHTHTHTHTSRYFSTYATHTTHAIYINLHNLIYIYTYARPSLGFRV